MIHYTLLASVCACTTKYRHKLEDHVIRLDDLSFTIQQCVFKAGSYFHAIPFLQGCQFIINPGHDDDRMTISMFDIPSHRCYCTPLPGKSFDRVLTPNEVLQEIEKLIIALRDGKLNPGIPFNQWLRHLPRNPAPKMSSTNTT